jgi:hypothetical protein
MQNSTIQKTRLVSAYVAGGTLLFLGILGLLVEFSKAKPSSVNFYGYGLAALFIASGILACVAARSQVRPVSAYVAGGALVFLGILGLLVEFSKAKPSSTNYYVYVRAVVLIASGVLTFVAARSHYGGGYWSFVGLICVAAATVRFASASQLYMRGRHLISPVIFFSTTAVLWGVGCYGLIWGHMQRHRKKKNSLHDTA